MKLYQLKQIIAKHNYISFLLGLILAGSVTIGIIKVLEWVFASLI